MISSNYNLAFLFFFIQTINNKKEERLERENLKEDVLIFMISFQLV